MINTMYSLYEKIARMDILGCRFTGHGSNGPRHYHIGICPICNERSFHFYDDSRNGFCFHCNRTFNMFTLCRDVLHLDGENMIRFIVGKEGNINEIDYREFARCVFSRVIDEEHTTFICPEDYKPIEACPFCGCKFFAYTTTEKGSVSPRCLYCGKFILGFKKIKNIKKRNSNQSNKWAHRIFERYDGKCAMCGSTDGLNAHHIIPWSICEELRYNIDNGILFCKKHHELAHKMVPMGNKYPGMGKAGV